VVRFEQSAHLKRTEFRAASIFEITAGYEL